MQGQERNERRKRSYDEEQKKGNEGKMPGLRYKYVLHHGKVNTPVS